MSDFGQFFGPLIICSLCRLSGNVLVLMIFGEVFYCFLFVGVVCGYFAMCSLNNLTLHLICQNFFFYLDNLQLLNDIIILQIASQTLVAGWLFILSYIS